MNDRFFCELCCRRYGDGGDCEQCPEEPLLDLADEDVREFLTERDGAVWRKRSSLYALVAGFGSIIPAAVLAGALTPDHPRGRSYGFETFLMLFVLGFSAGTAILMAVFPPKKKMPHIDSSEIDAWNEEANW